MIFALKSSLAPIGLDASRRPICAAQWHRSAGQRRLERLARIGPADPAGPLDQQSARQLRKDLLSAGFTGSDVVVAAPDAMLMSSIMELPSAASGAPTAQLARMEMSRLHNCAADNFEMFWQTLPRGARAANTDLVMATACLHESADALLDGLEAAGFRVRTLTSRICGLLQACCGLLEPVNGLAGLLDFTDQNARLSLLYQGTIVYERIIAADSTAFAQSQTAHTQAFIEGVRLPVSYVSNQYPNVPLEKIFVTGSFDAAAGALEALAEAIRCPVQPLLPRDVLGGQECACDPDLLAQDHMLAAIGLGAWDER